MKKFLSVILSSVILFISMGFTVSSHICGVERIKTVLSIGNTDVSCGMETTKKDCSHDKQMNSNCCQDEFQKMQLNDDYTKVITFKNFTPDFTIIFVALLFNILPTENVQTFSYKNYLPPPLVKDIKVLVQSFLI